MHDGSAKLGCNLFDIPNSLSLFQARCCKATISGSDALKTNNDCYWKWGGWGDLVQCDGASEAVFGTCGSGGSNDCNGGSHSHGIYCCKVMLV